MPNDDDVVKIFLSFPRSPAICNAIRKYLQMLGELWGLSNKVNCDFSRPGGDRGELSNTSEAKEYYRVHLRSGH